MRFKKTLFILIVFALPLVALANNDANTLFEKANAFYAKSQYKEATTAYQQLIDEGYQSVPLYFNMGNASFKNGDIPSALLYYEKAHKLAPGDDDINFNIRFANLRTTDKVDEAPEFFLYRWWEAIMLSFSISSWSAIGIVFILLGSAALTVYFFANSVVLKKATFFTSMLLFILFALTFFIAAKQTAYFEGHRQAIIFTSSVNVKNAPVDRSNNLFVIHDGTKVNVLDNNNGWFKISLANGNVGWIKAVDAKEI